MKKLNKEQPIVYVGMCADILHHGHTKLLEAASVYGQVTVGLLSDKAMEGYKRKPILTYTERKIVLESLSSVSKVVEQQTLSYKSILVRLKPDFVVHGNDWIIGAQQSTRNEVLETIHSWGGELIEPEYTLGISTSMIIERIKNQDM